MKKYLTIFILIFIGKVTLAQEETTVKKDSIKTEVVNVVTSYTPKVTDAFKIKKKPTIELSDKAQKKKLTYQIFPAPVASTFVPKSGSFKGVDLGEKERLYSNYVAVGFGNNTTPYFETFLRHSTRFENDFGLYAKYTSSNDPVKNTFLDSGFSNLLANLYYQQEDRSFDWKVGLDIERNRYNWYGLPNNLSFNALVLNAIDEKQVYNYINGYGKIMFPDNDSYINYATLSASYFFDAWNSNEIAVSLQPQFQFPLQYLGANWQDIVVDASLEYLGGKFNQSYENTTDIQHSFFTVGLKPTYKFKVKNFDVKLGTKVYFTSDGEQSVSQFFVYPDVQISYPIINNFANIYVGADGDLHTNSYKKLSDENPFISPTQFLTQTNEMYNFFGGFNGKLGPTISYNTRLSYSKEEDKALFSINNSKSAGNTSLFNGNPIQGFEYGNSYSVIYDDVNTLSFFGEIEWNFNKNLVLGANGTFNSYTPNRQEKAWNLPKLKSELFAKYKTKKWYAATNIFFVSGRSDVNYAGVFPSISNVISLPKYFDVNLNGGYHFNDTLSAFIKVNNLFNNNYERFSNFNVQGFQVLGGVTYKFDF